MATEQERIKAVAKKHRWSEEMAREKIERVQQILHLDFSNTVDLLLAVFVFPV